MEAVYTQLSLRERRRIEDWWHAKVPVREMARVLKRSKLTIHRAIKRNFWADDTQLASLLNRNMKAICDHLDGTPRNRLGCRTPIKAFRDEMTKLR